MQKIEAALSGSSGRSLLNEHPGCLSLDINPNFCARLTNVERGKLSAGGLTAIAVIVNQCLS